MSIIRAYNLYITCHSCLTHFSCPPCGRLQLKAGEGGGALPQRRDARLHSRLLALLVAEVSRVLAMRNENVEKGKNAKSLVNKIRPISLWLVVNS